MISELLWLPITLAILELYEVSIFKGETVGEILANIYKIYHKNLFAFFLVHLSFYFLLFVSLYYDVNNLLMLSLIGVKFIDIAYKIAIMSQVEDGKLKNELLLSVVETKVTPAMKYMAVVAYPLFFYFALA